MALKTCVIIYVLFVIAQVRPQDATVRSCGNSKCTDPISMAITTLKYNADHPSKLSFANSDKATVYAKGDDFWEVEINEKRGLVSPSFLKETKILKTTLVSDERDKEMNPLPADSNLETDSDPSQLNNEQITVDSDPTQLKVEQITETFEIVDGTTIYSPVDPQTIAATATLKQPENTAELSLDSSKKSDVTSDIVPEGDLVMEEINNTYEFVSTDETKTNIEKNDELAKLDTNENDENKMNELFQTKEYMENDVNTDDPNIKNSPSNEQNDAANNDIKSDETNENIKIEEGLTITTKIEIDPDQEGNYSDNSSTDNMHFNKTSQKNFEQFTEQSREETTTSESTSTTTESIPSNPSIEKLPSSYSTSYKERLFQTPQEQLEAVTSRLQELAKEDFNEQTTTSNPSEVKKDENENDDEGDDEEEDDDENEDEDEDEDLDEEEAVAKALLRDTDYLEKENTYKMITIDLPSHLLHPMDNSQDQDIEPETENTEEYESTTEEEMGAIFEELNIYEDETLSEGQLFNKYIRDIGAEDDLAIESPYPPGQDTNSPGFFAGIGNYIAQLIGFGSPDSRKIVEDDENLELTPEKLREMYPRRTFEEKRLEKLLETLAKREAAEKAACEAGEPTCPRRLQNNYYYPGINLTDILNLYNIVFQYDTLFYLLISACTVLCFTLGYYFIENKKLDGSLIAKVNELEKALLIANKECTILKEDLKLNEEQVVGQRPFDPSDYENELGESLLARQELQDKINELEKELQESTENGVELNKILNEYISTQSGSETITKTIDQLQDQLDLQREMIANLNASIEEKNIENKNLQLELNNSKKAGIASDKLIAKLRHNLDILTKDKKKLLEEIDSLKSHYSKELENKLTESEYSLSLLSTKDNEIKILQDNLRNLKELNEIECPKKIEELIQASEILATNEMLTNERDSLKDQLRKEDESRKLLEDNLRLLSEDFNKIKQNLEKAEHEKLDSENRLEVLSNYFKEKETELQKRMGIQEEIFKKKNIDANSFQEIIISLQKEVENYKSQNDILQKEIVDQERVLKLQLTTLEKKYQDHWITARQTERKLDECKQEAAQLRNRLTIVEKNIVNQSQDPTLINRLDPNGDLSPHPMGVPMSTSPWRDMTEILGFPPCPQIPPGAFMAPPPFLPPPPPEMPLMPVPPHLYPGDRRPPPLGRMSSPPPPGCEHSPPTSPRIGPFSPILYNMRYATPPPPPQPSLASPFDPYSRRPPSASWEDRFQAQSPPKRGNTSRNRGEQSSGNSSESNEKSSQHSGQV